MENRLFGKTVEEVKDIALTALNKLEHSSVSNTPATLTPMESEVVFRSLSLLMPDCKITFTPDKEGESQCPM